jgi:hypothetical protein
MVKTVGKSATWQLFGLFVKLKKIVSVVLNQLSEWLKSCQTPRLSRSARSTGDLSGHSR